VEDTTRALGVKGRHRRRPNRIPRTMRVVAIVVLIAAAAAELPAWAQPPGPVDIRGHWAEDRIQFLFRRNIVDLFPDQTFHPDEQITRGEFIKWLVLSSGLPLRPGRDVTFGDVPPAHPLFPFIDAAAAFGLLPRTPNFLPSEPMRRADAVVLAVKALGYASEASGLQSWPLPYDDTALLPDLTRGAIAIVLVADPPLLQEPLALSFRPSGPMTRAEASSLLGLGLLAAEQGLRLRYTVPVTRGADLRIEKRGVLHTLPVWRVQIGAFVSEENADRLADSIRARGLPAFIDFQDGYYKIRVGSFGTVVEAMLAKEQLAADGFPTWVIQTVPDFDALPGPFRTAALIVDPRAGLRIRPASGDGQRMRRMRTSEIARRTGALAATNGGFFGTSGDPLGCLMVAGEIFSEPDPQRSCAGFTDDGVILFDRVHFEASVTTPAGNVSIDGVNRDRRADELLLYQPSFDQSTHTNAFGAEAVISGGVVTAVIDLRGNAVIPRDGFVLSGHGRSRQWILQMLQPGTPVSVTLRFAPESGDARWEHVVHAVGGGPRLLIKGQIAGSEGLPATLVEHRHPRTAIGVLGDGRIMLLVVDGRQPPHSLGMTIAELAMELQRLGAVEAMNLDGGGSSTMVVAGRIVNMPSDEAGERPVASALVVLPPQSGGDRYPSARNLRASSGVSISRARSGGISTVATCVGYVAMTCLAP